MKKTMTAVALAGAALVGAAADGKPDKAWGSKLNWPACAEVTSRPALYDAAYLTDGDPRTAARFTQGVEDGAEFTVRFPKALEVTMVRFIQTGLKARHYRLWAQEEGATEFALAVDRTDEKPIGKEWIELPVNRKVTALRFEGVSGEVGYRAVFPQIAEFEIYSKTALGGGIPAVTGPRLVNAGELPMPSLTGTKFDFRVCTDWWNYNMAGWDKKCKEAAAKGEKAPALAEWPGFRGCLSEMRDLGVTSVRMFAESEACGKNGGFSSFPLEGLPADQQFDWMKPWAAAMHAAGLKVYYFSHAWRAPIQRIGKQAESPWCRWDYPYMASDALVGVNEHYKESYPCALSDSDFLDKWTALLRGALKAGADGVYLMPDEYYYKGHNLSRCTCESCRKGFREMFGYADLPQLQPPKVLNNDQGQVMPPIPVDTEQYRKWKVFEYRRLADLFTEVGHRLRKEFPQAQLVFNDNQAAARTGNSGLENTLAEDILGASDAYDQKQIYGGGTENADARCRYIMFAKHFAAAAGEKRLLSSAGWPAKLTAPADTYSHTLTEVMLGARRLEIYRLNYMQMNNGYSVYKKLFRMVRLLEKWGVFETETPNDVGLVWSRASADWWFVKANALIDPSSRSKATDFNLYLADESINKVALSDDGQDRTRFLAQERVRGFGAQQTVEGVLAASGFAYSVLYAERPDLMKGLKRFKTLVVPFAYSLSKDAAAEIAKAAEAGTKVILFGQLGPTDEYGKAYPEPALTNLFGKPGVVYVPGNPSDRSGDLRKLNEWANLVGKNTEGCVRVWSNGSPVSSVVRQMRGGRGWLVYLCNDRLLPERDGGFSAGTAPAAVTLSLPAAAGTNWTIESYSSDECAVSATVLDGQAVIPAEKLAKFTVGLAAQEVKLLRIARR